MADSSLIQLAIKDLDPWGEEQYQKELKSAGVPYELINGKVYVDGFGFAGNSQGDAARNYFNPQMIANRNATDALNKRQREETDARFAANKAEIQGITDKINTQVPKILGDTYSKYNIPDQTSGVNALNSRIQQLRTGSTMGETAGGYASASQVDKALQTGYIPAHNTAATNLNNSVNIASSEIDTLTKPLYTEASLINERIARETTGYTQLQQNELTTLLQNMQNGITLSEGEKNRVNQLALAELNFNNQLKLIGEESKYANKNTQIVETGGRKYLVDMNTGAKIQDLGPSGSGSGSGKTASSYLNSAYQNGAKVSGGGSGINNDWEYVT